MVFSSVLFLFFFLPACLLCYYIVPRKLRNIVLLLFSLAFYGWGEPRYIVIMLVSATLDFFCSRYIQGHRQNRRGMKIAVAISIVGNLGILMFFKYANFFLETLSFIPSIAEIPPLDIPLPIGISFYTFQTMSCTIDVYRDEAEVQANFSDFATYVTFFPQLVAGPIVRYRDIAAQLTQRRENLNQFASGLMMLCIGLGKKILIANTMGEIWNHFQAPERMGTAGAWLGITAFALQIYFDFSGYSDMAIGLGRLFGFEFPINFNYPYVSKSITEFWRRWHITLGTWFREYVYIPLGGNRRGMGRTLINLLIVWFLTGFWHGASVNFILWGLYFGAIIILERLFLLKVLQKLPRLFQHIYALFLILCGWVIFSFESLDGIGEFFSAMFTPTAPMQTLLNDAAPYYAFGYLALFLIAIIGATPGPKVAFNTLGGRFSLVKWSIPLLCLALLIFCTAFLVNQSYNPFLYFRF